MSESELKYPTWQAPLQDTILEFDDESLANKIQKVEILISERLQALSSETDHREEREALAAAKSILRRLRKEKLSYPEVNTQKQN
jgi:hypothetical protein